jgi:class 3 adenylate cyclase/pimeloyl-ACP methyl ester carboxylesterase
MTDSPPIQFATTSDGLKIAYHSFGSGKPVVRLPAVPFNNIRMEWELYADNRVLDQVLAGQSRRLVGYDPRGLGASSDTQSFRLSEFSLDLEAVADALGSDEIDLVAVTYSCPIAVQFAADNPGRVSHLVLDRPFVNGAKALETTTGRAIRALRNLDWEAYTDTALHTIFRENSEDARRSAAVLREARPETVKKIYDAVDAFDVGSVLSLVTAPTLVTYPTEEGLISREQSQAVAAQIPNAQFAIADGPGWLQVVGGFLGIFDTRPADTGDSSAGMAGIKSVRTILFTDLVGHTEMMSRLGDDAGRAVLREHERITREVLKQHGGTEVKTMGDGFMASFGSVTRAVECAVALQKAFAYRDGEPLSVRVGLNAGEPIEEDGDLFGATVILASRIAAKADGGEILVSDNVRSLCAGKSILFADRGEFAAKGFEEPVRVYEVNWRS